MSAHTLLPCPFCGYPPCYRFVTNPNGGNYPGHHEIWCEALSCDVGVEVSDVNLIEAELLWNTRAVNRDHHFDALVKALRESAADIVGRCKNPEDPYIAEALRRIGDVLASVGSPREGS